MTPEAVERYAAALRGRPIACVAIGASAGGVEALVRLVPCFRHDMPFAVVAVLHLPEHEPNLLPEILNHHGHVPVREAAPGESLVNGTVFIAPSGYHLYIEADHTFSFGLEEPVHYSRPSISVLLDSAAWVYRDKLLAILLTGANEDGAQGMRSVKTNGGATIVEDPKTAEASLMPYSALQLLEPDLVLKLDDIVRLMGRLSSGDA